MRESIDPMATPDAGAASRWSAPAVGEPRAGRSARTHRADEFPAGYSLAGCSPAEPAAASPASASIADNGANDKYFAANGELSLIPVSQPWGASQSFVISWDTAPEEKGDRLQFKHP